MAYDRYNIDVECTQCGIDKVRLKENDGFSFLRGGADRDVSGVLSADGTHMALPDHIHTQDSVLPFAGVVRAICTRCDRTLFDFEKSKNRKETK